MATVTLTPDQDAVVGEVFIAAPPDRVFQAITDSYSGAGVVGATRHVPHH